MKNITVFIASLLLTLAVCSLPARAGDDPVSQLTFSADAGAGNECSAALRPKTHYAVQTTVDVYVRVSAPIQSDGGTLDPATSANVKIAAGKLYDLWTTQTQTRICVKAVTAGASASLNIFQFRGPQE